MEVGWLCAPPVGQEGKQGSGVGEGKLAEDAAQGACWGAGTCFMLHACLSAYGIRTAVVLAADTHATTFPLPALGEIFHSAKCSTEMCRADIA